jgi:hypothetical protein
VDNVRRAHAALTETTLGYRWIAEGEGVSAADGAL